MNQPLPADYTPSDYRRALDNLGIVISFTHGISMRPLIWQGRHYVAIESLDGEPDIGDVLLFEQMRNGKTACILHRLVAIEAPYYITRGDNCLGCERIEREQIIGRMIRIYRQGPKRWFMAIGREQIQTTDEDYLRYSRRVMRLWPVRRLVFILRAWAHKIYRILIPRKTN